MSNSQDPEARNVAWSSLRTALAALAWTEQLQDQTPLGAGNFWVRKTYISTGQTLVPIQLPRQPSGMILIDNDSGAVVYRTAADVSASGPSTYACRATLGVSITAIFG